MNKAAAHILTLAFSITLMKSNAQLQVSDTDVVKKPSVEVAANPRYDKASGFKRMLLGKHYRKEWKQPVEVEIIDLQKEAGGLTPIREGGGHQTKSLRLRGNNGKEYVLRSVNKDPTKAVPPEFLGTFAADIVKDQISASNPYAPLVVAPLAEAAGIFHTWPKVVFVQQSPILDTFNQDFANTLCLFEERPYGSQKNNPAFNYADDISNTEKMLRRLYVDQDARVDQQSYLRARLFDMWIGDWDRHEDQWVWASFKLDGKTIFKPIPRDRDQAFCRLDGIIPKAASRRWAIRTTKNFYDPLHDVAGLNMGAINLDRTFTIALSLDDWKKIASDLQTRLTDATIEDAVKQLPEPIYKISGKKLVDALKERRSKLRDYAIKYFEFLNKEVDIPGTEDKELFQIDRAKDSTIVKVFRINKKGEQKDKLFERAFYKKETKELRLYGIGGDDQFVVNGNTNNGIRIRLIGGNGEDHYLDETGKAGKNVSVYDNRTQESFIASSFDNNLNYDTSAVNYKWRRYKYDWFSPVFRPGYNPDDGIYIGGGIIFRKQQFGKSPYGWMQLFAANYAFETGAYNFWYRGQFNRAVGSWNLLIDGRINAPNYVLNYFGMGNETENTTDDKNFNRVRSNQWILKAGLQKKFGKYWNYEALPFFQAVEVEKTEGRFIVDPGAKVDSSVFSRKYFGGAEFSLVYDHTNDPLYPTKGIIISSKLDVTQNLKDNDRVFGRGALSISGYASIHKLTFALRAGTAANFGNDYEFYQANTLGGSTNLRGFRRDRFAGKTSVYQNTEARFNFGTVNGYILKGQLGILVFSDVGRVWIPDEISRVWHWGYGGGFFFVPYNKLAFTVSYGTSNEASLLTLKAGFLF
jgi:hypothetical protein